MPVIFVLDIFRQFLGTTAYSLGVTNAVPMLKGVALGAKLSGPPRRVSSMPLKGTVRRRQVSKRQCLAEE